MARYPRDRAAATSRGESLERSVEESMGPGGDPNVPGDARQLRLGAIARSLGAEPSVCREEARSGVQNRSPRRRGPHLGAGTAEAYPFWLQARRSEAGELRDEAGKVLDQSPVGGERVKEGSKAMLHVGDGPASVEVPNVVGLSVSEAKARLGEAGLVVGSQREVPSDTAPKGVVVEQRYPAGTEVKLGTAANIGVSSEVQQVAAPDAPIQSTAAASATAAASPTAPPTGTVSATASAPALEEDAAGDVESGNSGPGSDNSGHGSSGGG
jgi:PASTA domain